MIIKQTRIRTGGTGTALAYIQAMGENEDVELLYGDPSSLARFANTMSGMNNHAYVLRHFIISPEQELTDDQIERCIESIQREFNTGDRPYVVARHQKIRSDENDASHIHIMMAESNTAGRVLTNKNNYKRNEKICRNLELEFGFELIKGRHNKYVIGHTENANNQLAMHLIGIADGDLPTSAYTKTMLGKAKRVNVDLPKLHTALKEVQTISTNEPADRASFIVNELLKADISLKRGNKKGILILYKYDEKTDSDVEFGSLHRLTKLNKNDISEIYPFIKLKEDNNEASNRTEDRKNRGTTNSNLEFDTRSRTTSGWSNSSGRNSGSTSRDTKTTDYRFKQTTKHSSIYAKNLKSSGFMINLQALARRKYPKGIGPSLSHSSPSSGAGPVVTDVFNDGAAALRAATKSIEKPGF
ncbi:relaxase/mobilization nuclease domain-containing protein [Paradonghicola geojensis]|nr:relaxase/mobilization nuclease domain-containing protein [Marivivens geojensis]